jgi:hypothetical protein
MITRSKKKMPVEIDVETFTCEVCEHTGRNEQSIRVHVVNTHLKADTLKIADETVEVYAVPGRDAYTVLCAAKSYGATVHDAWSGPGWYVILTSSEHRCYDGSCEREYTVRIVRVDEHSREIEAQAADAIRVARELQCLAKRPVAFKETRP